MASGRLLPNNHKPYSVVPTEPRVGHPPSPTHLPERPEDGSSVSQTQDVVEADAGNGNNWEQRAETTSSLPSVCLEDPLETRGEHTLDTRRFDRARMPSTQPVLSGVVIDRPFSTRRLALAELQFPGHDRISEGSPGWDMATSNNNMWGLDDPRTPYGGPESPRHRHMRNLATPSSAGVETRPTLGLDLARIREAGAPGLAGDLLRTVLPFPRGPSSKGFPGMSPACNTVGGKSLLPLSLSLTERDSNGLVDDWGAQGWREGDSRGPAEVHEWGAACPPIDGEGWGEADPGAHEPVWGEGGGQGESIETCQQVGDAREAVSDSRQSGTGGDAASLFGWTCYATSAAEKPSSGRTSRPERLNLRDRDVSAFHEVRP